MYEVGQYYWVLIVLDPDAEDWENEPMPARYAGDGMWFTINGNGETNWPVRWVGEKIVKPAL